MGYKNIILDEKDGILTITINRPKVLNALNTDTLNELENVVRDIERDKEIMVVIITGSGEKSFVAGADIAESPSTALDKSSLFNCCCNSFLDGSIPSRGCQEVLSVVLPDSDIVTL